MKYPVGHVMNFHRMPRRRPRKKTSSGLAAIAVIAIAVCAIAQLNKSGGGQPAPVNTSCVTPVKGAFLTAEGMWRSSRRNKNGPYPHRGLDIMQKTGTDIVAVKSGKVIFAGFRDAEHPEEGWGRIVYLQLDDGWTALNAHLDTVANGIQANKIVEKGQVIGTVGHTGNASEKYPHLHLEIGQPGDKFGSRKYADPQKWLQDCGGWDPKWVEHQPK